MSEVQEQTNKLRTLVQQNGALMTKVAQESTLLTESQAIQSAIQNIDLSSVENKVEEVKQTVEDIKLPEIDTTELAKESTLNSVSSKLDNLNVEVDLSSVAKQGENKEATNTAILSAIEQISYDKADVEEVIIFLSERV